MVMGADFIEGNDYQTENADRRARVQRSLAAVLIYHSGMLSDYGLNQDAVDERAEASREMYANHEVDEQHLRSAMSFRTQIGNPEDPDSIIFDRRIFECTYHLPQPSTITDFEPITYEWPLSTSQIYFDTYQDLFTAYRDFGTIITSLPSIILETINPMMRTALPASDPAWITQMDFITFTPPEIKLGGTPYEMSIGRLLSTSRFDGRLVRVAGQVMEVGDVFQRPVRASWRCLIGTCQQDTVIICDPFEEKEIRPDSCPSCGAGTPENPKPKWLLNASPKTTFTTQQRAYIQVLETETTNPPTLLVEIRGTDVNMLEAGEDVTLTGIYRNVSIEGTSKTVERIPILHTTEITTTSRQTSIQMTEEENTALYSMFTDMSFSEKTTFLISQFAQGIHGYEHAKGALLLQSIGASDNDKRWWINLFFCGDPGVAKTELKWAALNLHPASKHATGARASIPGLLGGQSDSKGLGGKRGMKPGILALIPKGAIAAIDELHSMESSGRTKTIVMLNEALESGIVPMTMQFGGTVRTETPVLCLSNPMNQNGSRFDMSAGAEPFLTQMGLDGAFCSRFDLIFVFVDVVDEERDNAIADAMMRSKSSDNSGDPWPVEDGLKKYLQMCRDVGEIDYSTEVTAYIKRQYYVARQNAIGDNRVSARWLASLMRLSEASARVDLSNDLRIEHVDYALSLLNESLTTKEPALATEGSSGMLQSQSIVYQKVRDLFMEHYSFLPHDQEWTQFDDVIPYVTTNWDLVIEDFPVPDNKGMRRILMYWKDVGDIRITGQRLKDNRGT